VLYNKYGYMLQSDESDGEKLKWTE
jgi:hypothetical protein